MLFRSEKSPCTVEKKNAWRDLCCAKVKPGVFSIGGVENLSLCRLRYPLYESNTAPPQVTAGQFSLVQGRKVCPSTPGRSALLRPTVGGYRLLPGYARNARE